MEASLSKNHWPEITGARHTHNVAGLIDQGAAAIAGLDRCRDLQHARVVTQPRRGRDVAEREVPGSRQHANVRKAISGDTLPRPSARRT